VSGDVAGRENTLQVFSLVDCHRGIEGWRASEGLTSWQASKHSFLAWAMDVLWKVLGKHCRDGS
jgi:hypothetical protein